MWLLAGLQLYTLSVQDHGYTYATLLHNSLRFFFCALKARSKCVFCESQYMGLLKEGVSYFFLTLCWEPKWCHCLSQGQQAGAGVETKPFLWGCEKVGTLLTPALAAQWPENSRPPHGVSNGVIVATPLSEDLSWGEPMLRGARELVLLFSPAMRGRKEKSLFLSRCRKQPP